MTARNRAVEAAAKAYARDYCGTNWNAHVDRIVAAVAVDAATPIIRAEMLADLRAQVQAMPGLALPGQGVTAYIHRGGVLALLDGGDQ